MTKRTGVFLQHISIKDGYDLTLLDLLHLLNKRSPVLLNRLLFLVGKVEVAST